jgi:hypothetical protein
MFIIQRGKFKMTVRKMKGQSLKDKGNGEHCFQLQCMRERIKYKFPFYVQQLE